MLGYVQDKYTPEDVVDLARQIEALIANLGKAQTLAYVVKVRERSAEKLDEWSNAVSMQKFQRLTGCWRVVIFDQLMSPQKD